MASSSPVDPNKEPYRYLGLVRNPNGSITRTPGSIIPTSPPSSQDDPALSKDLAINQENQTWARVYIPKNAPPKLPLVIYFHGGGFVLGSPSSSIFHKFCSELTSLVPAVVVSVEYRLAPEHRLPAAYDDSMEAIRWVETVEDDWLAKHADLSRCFLMGGSAGGNVAYHVGLRAATHVDHRIKIRGLILHQPFFGGVQRTPSEMKLISDHVIPLHATDIMWDLALPIGADRDHEYCNFTRTSSSYYLDDVFEKIKEKKWKVMVTGCDGDPLVDRQRQLVEMLKGKGVDVVPEFADGGCHGIEHFDDVRADVFYGLVKSFIFSL